MGTTITGTLGGVQISSLISAQDAANRSQAVTLSSQESVINSKNTALTTLEDQLNSLETSLNAITTVSFWESKVASTGDSNIATATVASTEASSGSYDIDILQAATPTVFTGGKASSIPAATATVASVFGTGALGTILVGTASGGTQTLTIDATTTLSGLASQIGTAIGGSASYDATKGTFTLTANDSLILSAGTSSFLQNAHLFNNYSARSASGTTLTGTETLGAAYGASFVNGTFQVNGVAIQTSSTDTVNDVISRINAQVPGASASLVNGRLTINSTSPITVANGTGSFFNQAGLATSSATTTTSTTAIGSLDTASTTVGSTGSFTVNGVSISYSSTDTIGTVLSAINASTAGVTATYDSYNDRIVVTDNVSGPNAVILGNDTGTFLTKFGLSAGTQATGNSTIFTVNGGAQRVASTNTLSSDDLGIAGLSLVVKKAGETTVTVGADTSSIKAVLDAFVDQYNTVQQLTTYYTTVDTSNSANNGVLANDGSITQLGSRLRLVFGSVLDSSGTYRTLGDLGITGNASDNTATPSDATNLDNALTNNLDDLKTMFLGSTTGLGTQLTGLINGYVLGSTSVIQGEINSNKTALSNLDNQISQINNYADMQLLQLQSSYAAYSAAQQQASSLTSYFSSSSSSSSSSNSAGGILG
ncbi:MAG TPA: flagellar filament capping protein FliD [Candidatus Methylacidiphilales bacterium]